MLQQAEVLPNIHQPAKMLDELRATSACGPTAILTATFRLRALCAGALLCTCDGSEGEEEQLPARRVVHFPQFLRIGLRASSKENAMYVCTLSSSKRQFIWGEQHWLVFIHLIEVILVLV